MVGYGLHRKIEKRCGRSGYIQAFGRTRWKGGKKLYCMGEYGHATLLAIFQL